MLTISCSQASEDIEVASKPYPLHSNACTQTTVINCKDLAQQQKKAAQDFQKQKQFSGSPLCLAESEEKYLYIIVNKPGVFILIVQSRPICEEIVEENLDDAIWLLIKLWTLYQNPITFGYFLFSVIKFLFVCDYTNYRNQLFGFTAISK